ncbi:MAG: hypothetical protein FWG42_02805 [Clostridiales bacterium]|nr:hypothetical protein [Clostridiales bacterium]
MERAETLDTILQSFARDQLKEDVLPMFYYDKTMAVRIGKRNSPMDALFRYCTVPLTKNAHLLLGHSSCGKSTELHKLKQRLEDAGHPVWMVNANLDMDLFQANCWDVMLNITEGLFKIADGYSIEIPEKTREAVLDYLKSDKETIEEKGKSRSIDVSAGIGAKTPSLQNVLQAFASLKGELKASIATRVSVKEKMERRASEWLSYIIEIADCISNSGNKKQPVLIFVNMDKIQPPDKAFDIFCYSVLAQMPFPIIYTFPISLFYDSRFAAIMDLYEHHLLPMIKVSNIDMSENADGINAIREIVKLRADLKLFDSDALNLLISKTGGVLRHLFNYKLRTRSSCSSRCSHWLFWNTMATGGMNCTR